jgi:hypothetical protein
MQKLRELSPLALYPDHTTYVLEAKLPLSHECLMDERDNNMNVSVHQRSSASNGGTIQWASCATREPKESE